MLMNTGGAPVTAALKRAEIETLDSLSVKFTASADAATDSKPPGIGGFCHGLYWYIPIAIEWLAYLHITVLELLATGLGEKSLADHLGVTRSSARSLSRDLHARLQAHDRRDIERLGARLGYTRFGKDGLQPFGLSVSIDEYRAQSRRPAPLPAMILSLCGMKTEE